MAKKEKIYIVTVPVRDAWVFRVPARNKAEAWRKASRGDASAEQLCTQSGARKSIKLERKK